MKSMIAAFCLILLPMLAGPALSGSVAHTELEAVYFEDPGYAGLLQTSVAWGDIRVRAHERDSILVRAAVTTDTNEAPMSERAILEAVDFEFVRRGNVIDLRISSRLAGFHATDLEILVPQSTAVALEVRRGGNVLVEGLDGEVEISNRNGSVELEALGAGAVVHARNGSITAGFRQVDPELPLSFSTLNGSVDVTLPPTIAADLRVRYNRGGVESDFAIDASRGTEAGVDVEGLEGRETRVFEGRINGGGPPYRFETANGTVYLRRAR